MLFIFRFNVLDLLDMRVCSKIPFTLKQVLAVLQQHD